MHVIHGNGVLSIRLVVAMNILGGSCKSSDGGGVGDFDGRDPAKSSALDI